MALNEKLTDRVREKLARVDKVEEKKMFRGITFMVDGKMCVSVGDDRLMCRIDPAIYDEVLDREGCQPVKMKGKEYKGYVYVNEAYLNGDSEFDYWIQLALEFNKKAKASPKRN